MKTVILNDNIKTSIIKDRLSDNAIFETEFISVSTFINRIINREDNIYDISLKLKKLCLNDLSDNIIEPSFIKNLLKDADEMMKYRVSIDDLKISDDYRLCLKTVMDNRYDAVDEYIESHDFSDYEIYDTYYDIYERNIIKRMCNQGARLISIPKKDHHTYTISLKTMREAVASVASYIISNHLDLNDCVIVADSSSIGYIRTILNLYHISSYGKPYMKSSKAYSFNALMDFYLDPCIDNYLNVVTYSYKGNEDIISLNTYYHNHVSSFSFDTFDTFKDEKGYYQNLESEVNEINSRYFDELKTLLTYDFDDAVIYAFDLIKDESDETIAIKNIIEKYAANLKDSYYIYREELENLLIEDSSGGIKIISYHEDIYFRDYIFVLNPDMKVYPGFKPLEGFIAEKSILDTSYPSIRERYDNHNELFRYLDYSKVAILMTIQSTFNGKAPEYDDSIGRYDRISIDIINNEYDGYLDYNHHISKDNAHKIFLKNNEIAGSISSFEKYFKCPYCYFLNYGMKLYDPQLFELNAALTGTLIHEIMEITVKEYHKEYYKHYKEAMNEILKKYEDKLINMYPNIIGIIKSSIIRIRESIVTEMEFIRFMEENSDYIPFKTELKFNEILLTHNDIGLRLRGIIDRVDINGDRFRIVDYKTSNHALSKNDISKGIQLQLLTYALIYHKISQDTANGVFYLNIKHSPDNYNEYAYSKKTGIEENLPDFEKDFISSHKLKGFFFEDDDNEYQHILSGKKQGVSKRYLVDYDKTETLMTEIYEYLIDNLLDGNIALIPDDSACTYCSYHRICHFRGIKGLNKKISETEIGSEEEDES